MYVLTTTLNNLPFQKKNATLILEKKKEKNLIITKNIYTIDNNKDRDSKTYIQFSKIKRKERRKNAHTYLQ
jgi:hypothetical protein